MAHHIKSAVLHYTAYRESDWAPHVGNVKVKRVKVGAFRVRRGFFGKKAKK
jgi:hypothetical protein